MPDSRDLDAIFKAYDIRGVVPDQFDTDVARAVGGAFVEMLASEGDRPKQVVLGYDMRVSSTRLAEPFAEGVAARGADVVRIGLASTDELYFAAGRLDAPGAMFTASHNPPQYGGIKLCRAGAAAIGRETGLDRIRQFVEHGLPEYDGAPGVIHDRDLLAEYADHLLGLVDLSAIRPLRVVVDAGNGMAGQTVPAVLGTVPAIELQGLYFELDGTFPNHHPNPIDPANLVDLQTEVRRVGADIGLAFDGDADRCWVIDERGESVSPSAVTALVAVRELAREPGASIIHNLITSRAVPEIVAEHGGTPIRERVGHSFIKARMAETGALFGGEHSAHFYFRDFWRADSGLLAALHVLAALGSGDRPLSELIADYSRYSSSGELNTEVRDTTAALNTVREAYQDRQDIMIDDLDGLTVVHDADPMWWFNVRPSNTEPMLRLNVESVAPDTMGKVRDGVLDLLKGFR